VSASASASTSTSSTGRSHHHKHHITEYGVDIVPEDFKDPYDEADDTRVQKDVEKFYDTLYQIILEKHANPYADFQADYQGFLVDFSADCYMLAQDVKFKSLNMCEELVKLLETTFRSENVFGEGHDDDFLSQVDEDVEEYRVDYGVNEYQSEYQSEYQGEYMGQSTSSYLAHDRMVVDMALKLNYGLVAGDPQDQHIFVKAFVSATAKTLFVPDSRISVLDIQDNSADGGIEVKFSINAAADDDNKHSNPSDPSSVDALADKFVSLSKDTSSDLYNSPILSRVDLDSEIKLTKELASDTPIKHAGLKRGAATRSSTGPASSSASAISSLVALLVASLFLLL